MFEEALGSVMVAVLFIAGANYAHSSASHCVTSDTFVPVLITYLLSQSLKEKFNPTMEGVLVISASLLA